MLAATNITGKDAPLATLANTHDYSCAVIGIGTAGHMPLTGGLPTKKISLWIVNLVRTAWNGGVAYRSGFCSVAGDLILKKNGNEVLRLPFAGSAKFNGDTNTVILNGNGYKDDQTSASIAVNSCVISGATYSASPTEKVTQRNLSLNSVGATVASNCGMIALPAAQLNAAYQAAGFFPSGSLLQGSQQNAPFLEVNCEADKAEFLVKSVNGTNWIDTNTQTGFMLAFILCSVVETGKQISQYETANGLN